MEVSVQARQVGRGDNRFISSVEPCEVATAMSSSILDLQQPRTRPAEGSISVKSSVSRRMTVTRRGGNADVTPKQGK